MPLRAAWVVPPDGVSPDYHVFWEFNKFTVVIDKFGYGEPTWNPPNLTINNRPNPDQYKKVWLLMQFEQGGAGQWQPPQLAVSLSASTPKPPYNVTLDIKDTSLGSRQLYWEWTIRPQPDKEVFKFDPAALPNGLVRLDIATKCIPEPGLYALLAALGLVGFGVFRKYKG